MSRTIDERIVEMEFDNAQFEKNVATSMNTLDKLKSALKLDGVAKGFDDIDKSSKKIDMNPLSKGLQTVQANFSAMQVVAITALANITNSAIEAGKNLVNAFAIRPIKDGFAEYELLMDSVKTIKASTGESVQTINKYLDDLNTYADKTIYTFSDMTQNIGKFTNAGVKLDSAVNAIKGISNEAAVSGANANEASRAMYNFAQALSAGYVKLIDWKSIENANMATVEFKQALIDTGLAMGTLVKEGDDYITTTTNAQGKISDAFNATKGFNDALQNQWMTSEVLVQTLEQYSTDVRDLNEEEKKAYETKLKGLGYTDEQIKSIEELGIKAADAATKITKFTQLIDVTKEAVGSGWAQTFRLILGDFEEAQDLWTKVGDAVTGYVDKTSDARNETIKIWKILGGRDALIQAFENVTGAIKSVLTPIKEAFDEVFPPVAPRHIVAMTKALAELTSNLSVSGETAENIKKTFSGIFSVFHMLGTVIGTVIKVLSPLGGIFGGILKVILNITAPLGDFLVGLDKIVTQGAKSFSGLSSATQGLSDAFNNLIDNFSGFRIPFERFMTDSQKERAYAALTTITNTLSTAFENAKNTFLGFINHIKNYNPLMLLAGAFMQVRDSLAGIGKNLIEDFVSGLEKISTIKFTLSDSFDKVRESAANVKNIFSEVGKSLKESFIPTDGLIKDASDRYKKITGKITSGLDVKGTIGVALKALNTGIFGALLLKVSEYVKKVNTDVKSVKDAFVDVLDQLKNTLKVYQTELKAETLKKIAEAIAILAASVFVLSRIDGTKLITSLGALAGVATILGIFTKEMSKLVTTNAFSAVFGKNGGSILTTGSNIAQIGTAMVAFAAAIGILSLALKSFENMNLAQVGTGIVALGGIAAILTKTMGEIAKMAPKLEAHSASVMKVAFAMILVAEAMKIMAVPVEKLGAMNPEQLAKGLVSVLGLLAGVTGALKALEKVNPASVLASAASMMLIATALTALAVPVSILGLIPYHILEQGLTAVGIGLFTMAAALKLVSSDIGGLSSSAGKILATGAAMMMIAAAMNELIIPILILGAIPWPVMLQGMGAVVVGLAAMTASLKILQTGGGLNSVGVGAGLMMIAAAMNMLLPVILTMGLVPWQVIAQGLGLLVAGLLGLAVVGKIATTASVGLTALGTTLLMMSGAFLIFNAGLALFGIALASVAAGLTALAALGPTAANAILSLVETLTGGFLTMIVNMKAQILEAIIALVDVVLDGLIETTPKIMDFINTFLVEAIATFVSVQGAAVEGLLLLIDGILSSLVAHGPSIIDKLLTFIIQIIDGITAKIPQLFSAIGKLVSTIVTTILSGVKDAMNNPSLQNVLEFGGILAGFMVAMAALSALAAPAMLGVLAFGALITELSLVLAAVGALNKIPGLQQFVDSGGDLLQSVGTAIGKFVGGFIGGALEGIIAQLPQIATDLSDFAEKIAPFISYVKNIDSKAVAGCASLAGMIIALTGASVITGVGLFLGGAVGFAAMGLELKALGPMIADFAKSIDGIDAASVTAAANAAKCLSEVASNLPSGGGLLTTFFGGSMSMQEFGNQLDWFGYYIVRFSDRVKGKVDEAAVTAAANAGKTMVELAKTIPNSGPSVASFFLGDNDMKTFGNQLDWFGYYIVRFSERVAGKIDEAAVTAAAAAGKIMVELADTIPNSGPSVVSFFVGDNDMKTFGMQLDWFGYYLASYANRVANLSVEAVQNSATAAKFLVGMTNELGNSGEMIRTLVGGSLMTAFGIELANFADGVARYSDTITKLNLPSMQSAVIEIQKLVALGRDISTLDTSVYSSFSKSLETMAKNGIDAFIKAFTGSAERAKAAVTAFVNGVNTSLQAFVPTLQTTGISCGEIICTGLIQGIENKKPQVLSTITKLCNDMINLFKKLLVPKIWFDHGAITIMQSLINGLNSKKPMLVTTITTICTTIISTFKSNLPPATFHDFGVKNIMESLIDGINSKKADLVSKVEEICKAIIDKFTSDLKPETFKKFGVENIMESLIDGIESKKRDLINKIEDICEAILKAFENNLKESKFEDFGKKCMKALVDGFKKNDTLSDLKTTVKKIMDELIKTLEAYKDEFVKVGKAFDEGLAKGIKDTKGAVLKAVEEVVKEAVKKAKDTGKVKSPSRVFAEIGKYFDLGMAQGMEDNAYTVAVASENLSNTAINTMRDAIKHASDVLTSDFSTQPVITPIVDLSNVQNSSRKMRGLLTKGLNTSMAYNNAVAITPTVKSLSYDDASDSNRNKSVVSNNYNFTQNNYSPKALSRKEIYRQTKNTFSMMKGAVNAV